MDSGIIHILYMPEVHSVEATVFLGALAKLRKATVSLVVCVHLSVYPSVRTEQLSSHGADFHEI